MLRKMLIVSAVAALVGLTGSARADNGTFKVLAPEAPTGARPEMLATAGKITMIRLDGAVDPNEAAMEACRGGGRGGGRGGFSRGGRGFGRGYARGGRGYGRGYGRGWGRGYRHHYGRGYYGGYSYPDCYDYSYCENDYTCYQPSYCDYSCYQPCYYYYGCSGQIGSLSLVDTVHSDARAEIKRTETKLTLPTPDGKKAK